MKRKIAAIMAADVAGFSRLVAEDEEETLRRLASYRAVFSDCITGAGGRIFNTAGDAILAEFTSAVDAVRCAVDVQESLKSRNQAYPPSRQMNFRIGITIGDVVERDGDLLGDGVNIAARLEGLAPAGGISVSRSVYEAVANKVSVGFTDLGQKQLKNIPERVQVYTINDAAHAGRGRPSGAAGGFDAYRMPAIALAALLAGAAVMHVLREPAGDPGSSGKASAPATEPASGKESAAPAMPDNKTETAVKEPAAGGAPAAEAKPLVIETQPAAEGAKPDSGAGTPEAGTPAVEGPSGAAPAPAAGAGGTSLDDRTARIVLPRALKDCLEGEIASAAGPCRTVLAQGYVAGPDLAAVELRLGRSEREAKEPSKAIEAYTRSIAAVPTSEAYNHRGIAYFDKGELEDALADLTKAIELDPKNGEALNNRAWLKYRQERPKEALEDADKAVRLLAKAAYVWDTRGHIHEALANTDAAIKDFREALALDPEMKSSREGLERLGAKP